MEPDFETYHTHMRLVLAQQPLYGFRQCGAYKFLLRVFDALMKKKCAELQVAYNNRRKKRWET
jgi:hypothetical protein